jgi:selenium-binding protein 1
MKAMPETLASIAGADPDSKTCSTIIGPTAMPHAGDAFHHFCWNPSAPCLCPNAPHPDNRRRCLVVPGSGTSRIQGLVTRPGP